MQRLILRFSLAATHGFPQFCILVFPVALKVLIFVVSSVLSAKLQYTLPRTPPRPDATAIYFSHTVAYPEVFSGSNSRFSPTLHFGLSSSAQSIDFSCFFTFVRQIEIHSATHSSETRRPSNLFFAYSSSSRGFLWQELMAFLKNQFWYFHHW